MIQSKTLISVLIMGAMTTACSSGGSSGNSPKTTSPYPYNHGAGLVPANPAYTYGPNGPVANGNPNSVTNPNPNANKTVGMYEATPSGAALTGGSAVNDPAVNDPFVDSLDLTRPLTPTSYSPGYQQTYNQNQYQPYQPSSAPVSPSAPMAQVNNFAPTAQPTQMPVAPVDSTVDGSQSSASPSDTPVAQTSPAPADPSAATSAPTPTQSSQFPLSATDNQQWVPGLPPGHDPVTDPTHQIVTDPNFTGIPSTDSKEDYIMAHFLAKLDKDKLLNADRVFAMQIVNANVTRTQNTFTAKIQILEDGQATPNKITLIGKLNDPANLTNPQFKKKYQLHNDRKALLQSSQASGSYRYLAHMTCWDQNQSTCQNSVLELVRETTSTAVPAAGATTTSAPTSTTLAKAYIVYRLGPADLTIAPNPASTNSNQSQFDQYLLDSALNSCLLIKASAPADMKAAYEQVCPGTTQKLDGAHHILMKSWAVALGTAKFSLIFQNDDTDTQEFTNAVVFHGDLVMSQSPVPLKVAQIGTNKSGLNYGKMFDQTDGAELMANDGAGDLNLHIIFAGSPAEDERFSVTTHFEVTVDPTDVKTLKQQGTVGELTPQAPAAPAASQTVTAAQTTQPVAAAPAQAPAVATPAPQAPPTPVVKPVSTSTGGLPEPVPSQEPIPMPPVSSTGS